MDHLNGSKPKTPHTKGAWSESFPLFVKPHKGKTKMKAKKPTISMLEGQIVDLQVDLQNAKEELADRLDVINLQNRQAKKLEEKIAHYKNALKAQSVVVGELILHNEIQ